MKNLILIVFLLSNALLFAQDNDGDGFTVAMGDCNDNNANVFPGAVEIPCDNIDNNCDTNIDENRLDADGDTFDECVDCNDNDPNIFPGATEIPCDNIDNNCDTNIDENRQDADGDSFDECVDCNDNNDSIFPGAVDIPDNGIDEDCNGSDNTTLSVSELNEQFKIRVYPNPVSEYLNIIPSKTDINLNTKIYDISGKIILTTDKETIDFRSFNRGIYILEIYSGNNKNYLTNKIIIKN